MNMFHSLSALALAGLVASMAAAEPNPESFALRFCEAVRSSDEALAEALMSPDLQAAIARLRVADAEFRIAYPGDKPPLGDGLRLTAYPDGLDTCTPIAVTADSADLVYVPGSDPSATWQDRLVLMATPDGGVLVADILYAPDQTARFSDWLSEGTSWK
jgi:hypothetical protein